MIFTTLIATTAMSFVTQQASAISCPITGEPIVKGMKVTEYNGVRFTYCCAGCDTQFEKDPKVALDKAVKSGKTIGVFLFDPISMKRLEADKAKGGFTDYKGLRFYFESEADKNTFDKEPAKFGVLPKKEALYCPVSKEVVTSYAKASGYGDFNGTRYYFCCGGCEGPFGKEPAKFADVAKGYVKAPAPMAAEKADHKSGGGDNK